MGRDFTSKQSDKESSKTQFKYMLASSVLAVAINTTYLACWRFGGFPRELFPTIILVHSFLSISPHNILVAFFAALIGTYVGLWTIGKVKLDSPVKGLTVGFFIVMFLFPVTFFLFTLYFIYVIPSDSLIFLGPSLIAVIFENSLGSLFGGFIGGILVEFVAPDYCPKCGANLKAGILYCPNCGWGK